LNLNFLQAQWSLFPSGYRSELLAALEITLPTLNNRELSNILWALGKLNVDYNLDLSVGFRDALMSCLIAAADNLKLFDLESIFVGLGLMQVRNSLLYTTLYFSFTFIEP
jgi:hypothetical protein